MDIENGGDLWYSYRDIGCGFRGCQSVPEQQLLREKISPETRKGAALSRSDSEVKSRPYAMLLRQMLNSEA